MFPIWQDSKEDGKMSNKLVEYIESLTDEQINVLFLRLPELIEQAESLGLFSLQGREKQET